MDPYQILGLAPGASEEEVRAAYRRLAQTYNPENYEAGPLRDQARARMEQIDAAFDAIMGQLRTGKAPGPEPGGTTAGPTGYPQIRALISAGRADEALAALQQVPNGQASAEWNFLMGSAYYYKGWLGEAQAYFEQACRMAPSNREYAAAYRNLKNSAGGQMPGNPYNAPYGMPQSGAAGCSCCDVCVAMMCMDMCCGCGRGC